MPIATGSSLHRRLILAGVGLACLAPGAAAAEPSVQLIGRADGRDVDLPSLQRRGVRLLGRFRAADQGLADVAGVPDLAHEAVRLVPDAQSGGQALLGEGVASSTRPDPQAKGLGEYLRSRLVDVPAALLGG